MLRCVALGGVTLILGALSTARLGAQEKPDRGQFAQGVEPAHRVLQAPEGYFRSVSFSPDGKMIAAGATQGDKVYVWDIAAGKMRTRLQFPQQNYNYNLVFSTDCRTLISAGREDDMIRFWDIATGKQIREVKRHGRRFFAFAPGGLHSAESEPKFSRGLNVVETGKGKVTREFKGVNCVGCDFSPDGQMLATHAADGEITLWNPNSGAKIRTIRDNVQLGGGAFNFVLFSPDGKHLASGGHIDKQLRIFETATGKERAVLHCKGFFCSASFSPDGAALASGSTDGLLLYDLVKDREICTLKPAFPGQFVAFSPDGTLLAVGGDKGNIYLYQIPETRRAKLPKQLNAGELNALYKDLGAKNDFRFQEVTAHLRAAPKDAVAFLSDKVVPVSEAARKQALKCIADLDDDNVDVRDRAMGKLQSLAAAFEPLMVEQRRTHVSSEVRNRLAIVVAKQKEAALPTDLLVSVRAIGVLQQIGTTEARKVLEGLAKGAAQARLTGEARAALDRLGKASKTQ